VLPDHVLTYEDVVMTGEPFPPSPAAGAPGPGAEAELRASHADRDRVAEILRVAAGDGRLTAAELDERLEAALTARTHGELARLTADLPAAAGPPGSVRPQAKELVRIERWGGNVKREGRWVVPQRMEISCVGGTVKLDFTDAVITHPTLRIEARKLGGNLVLVTKPGIEVDTDDVRALGGNVRVRPVAAADRPVILRVEISGQTVGGNVVVRPRRRTFWQWLLRKGPSPRSITG
jgi:hypothetical protein